ncbi:enoyl-CoA hydratase/isomerase family protein [Variovorax sp. WS11]|uniref:enoyl-CoA hydratase/isomerase family protein n=1 Tax=Variovorax sp. WS11 TaxID=1105204 RepID=UPI0013DC191A|nr:enoyl-CoA hydratase/isomerase family protein [Variovorax sp. WS11]NDZ18621.1 enoyl-CoA hydratase/isomerase family protein [Variovorax sp. WS11]
MARVLSKLWRDGVLQLVLEHAPVNSLSHPMRLALWEALEAADADPAVRAIVIGGAGRGFSAGGDYAELRSPLQQQWPALSAHLFPRIEACTKPMIAAIHGFAIGGGFELALACHYRVAQRDARIALPELKHGVVPPSGSQRLPRAVGVGRALALILAGEPVRADRYADTPLFDRLCEADPLAAARAFAAAMDRDRPPASVLLRHRPLDRCGAAEAIAAYRARLGDAGVPNQAALGCIDAVECAVNAADFDGGLAGAKRIHDELSVRARAGTG